MYQSLYIYVSYFYLDIGFNASYETTLLLLNVKPFGIKFMQSEIQPKDIFLFVPGITYSYSETMLNIERKLQAIHLNQNATQCPSLGYISFAETISCIKTFPVLCFPFTVSAVQTDNL